MRGAALLLAATGTSAIDEFSVYTEPMSLLPGQVHNNPVKPVPLPDWVVQKYAKKPMGVVKFQLDIVQYDGFGTAAEKRVPLSEIYNHHTIQVMGTAAAMQQQYVSWYGPDPLGPHPQDDGTCPSGCPTWQGDPCFCASGACYHDGGSDAWCAGKPDNTPLPDDPQNAFCITDPTLGPLRIFVCNATQRAPDAAKQTHCGSQVGLGLDRLGKPRAGGRTWQGPIGGAEYRDADRDLPLPYRQIVDTPQAMTAILHFINIKGEGKDPADYPRQFECPCTSHRKFDLANGTIDGVLPLPFNCNEQLMADENADCALKWYKGGYRCCENGVFVAENPDMHAPKTTVVGKFTFRIDDVAEGIFTPAASKTKAVYPLNWDCTAPEAQGGDSGLDGNAEYEIPPCDPSAGECVHVVDTVQTVSGAAAKAYGPDFRVELITARGHQHVAGLGMEVYNNETGELLCKSHPAMGNSSAAGDEAGYIVGIPPCVWGTPGNPPPVLRAADKVRIVSRYNSTVGHHGVMCFWFMQVAAPDFK